MKNILYIICIPVLIGLSSCEVDEILNPNAPTVESFQNGATLADLKLLCHGLQGLIREDMQFHFWTTSVVGREYFDLRGTDPRYTSELLGQNGGDLDNNGFLTTRTYFGRYRSVRNAILLKTAVQNTAASLTASESSGLTGFANTIIAYEMLLEATRQFDNGIRLDVVDVNNLGPFTGSFQESLSGIKSMLDEAHGQLSGADENLIFDLQGFGTISDFSKTAMAQFNRAIAARVAIYQRDKSAASAALDGSFLDLSGNLNKGAYYAFGGATGNDLPNPLFYVPGVDNYMAHESFVDDAEAGDARLSKVTQVAEPIILDGLGGDDLVSIYSANTSEASIIRNEELILIYAEAKIGSDNAAAVTAINTIRVTNGLGAYSGATDDASLIDEILDQRRYSLFGEGHRWIDLRRYSRLGDLPLDRAGDKVHVQFPRPASEL